MTPQRPITTVKNAKADYNSHEEGVRKILVGDVEEAVQLSALGNPLEWAASPGANIYRASQPGSRASGVEGLSKLLGLMSPVSWDLDPQGNERSERSLGKWQKELRGRPVRGRRLCRRDHRYVLPSGLRHRVGEGHWQGSGVGVRAGDVTDGKVAAGAGRVAGDAEATLARHAMPDSGIPPRSGRPSCDALAGLERRVAGRRCSRTPTTRLKGDCREPRCPELRPRRGVSAGLISG